MGIAGHRAVNDGKGRDYAEILPVLVDMLKGLFADEAGMLDGMYAGTDGLIHRPRAMAVYRDICAVILGDLDGLADLFRLDDGISRLLCRCHHRCAAIELKELGPLEQGASCYLACVVDAVYALGQPVGRAGRCGAEDQTAGYDGRADKASSLDRTGERHRTAAGVIAAVAYRRIAQLEQLHGAQCKKYLYM